MSTESTPPKNSEDFPQEARTAITVDLQVLHAMLAAVEADEAKEVLRHTELMALLANRRVKYSTTLSVLVEMYPSVDTTKPRPVEDEEQQPIDSQPTPNHKSLGTSLDNNHVSKLAQSKVGDTANAPRKREKHGVLKRTLLTIFKQRDTFLATEDFKKVPALKGYTSKRITDGLKDARRPGQGVIGIQVYSGAFPKFINGLAEFFEDTEGKYPKPGYAEKLRGRLSELGLTSEPNRGGQTAREAKSSPLFQTPNLRASSP